MDQLSAQDFTFRVRPNGLVDAVVSAFENADVKPENFNRKHRNDLCELVFIFSVGDRKRMIKTIVSKRLIESDKAVVGGVLHSMLLRQLPHSEPAVLERVYGFKVVDISE